MGWNPNGYDICAGSAGAVARTDHKVGSYIVQLCVQWNTLYDCRAPLMRAQLRADLIVGTVRSGEVHRVQGRIATCSSLVLDTCACVATTNTMTHTNLAVSGGVRRNMEHVEPAVSLQHVLWCGVVC